MKEADEKNGIWRTIGGRRIFIQKGENLTDAMKRSGKFKTHGPDDPKIKKANKPYDKDDLKESDNNHKIKIGSKVYWIGAGNEISAEGEVIDFPVDGRMTIKWGDNEQNTYDITHPNIILADNYDNSVNEPEESKKLQNQMRKKKIHIKI